MQTEAKHTPLHSTPINSTQPPNENQLQRAQKPTSQQSEHRFPRENRALGHRGTHRNGAQKIPLVSAAAGARTASRPAGSITLEGLERAQGRGREGGRGLTGTSERGRRRRRRRSGGGESEKPWQEQMAAEHGGVRKLRLPRDQACVRAECSGREGHRERKGGVG